MKFRNITIFAFCALAVSPSFASRDERKENQGVKRSVHYRIDGQNDAR